MTQNEEQPSGFVEIVESLGLTLSKEGEPNQLDGEPALFKLKLLQQFNREDAEEFTEEFVEGMIEYFNSHRCFRACLMPTVLNTSKDVELSLLAPRESLFRYILGIESLQEKIVEVLIIKLIEVTSQEDRCDFDTTKTIINQFRWLEQIADPRYLLEKLIELIGISPLNVQQEIISALPDIFVDVDHSDLLEKLVTLAQDSNDLFVPVIECLGNINIPGDEISRISELILKRLDSVDLDSLAVSVHFLLLMGTEEAIYPTLTAIRAKIDLDALRRIKKKDKATKRVSNKPRSYETLLLDKLEKILVSRAPVKTAWLKLLEGLRGEDKMHSLDVLVLVILHGMSDTKKKVEQLFKSKVSSGLFKKDFLTQAIKNFLPLVEKKTMELLTVAEFLLRDSQANASLGEISAAIYCAVFESADIYHRQEVVGMLIIHIGSGNAWEINYALDALDAITRKDPPGVLRFAIFVKGILDYLDRLTLDQVSRLFIIYTTLSLEEGTDPGDGGLKNDLHMIIRKQLSHPSEKYKKIGIASSLAMVKQMSCHYAATIHDPRYSCGSSSKADPTHPVLAQAISMLKLLQAACHKSVPSLPVAYNGLSRMILAGELHADLVQWISDNIVVLFAELFVIETDEGAIDPVHPPSWPDAFQMDVWDDLNGGGVALAINVLPTVVRHFYNNRKSYHPSFICALFNLYQACEKFVNGSLGELDALLGCGIVMFNKEILSTLSKDDNEDMQDCLVLAMVVALNWYRELINAFHINGDPSLAPKLKARVGHLVQIEEMLGEFSVHKYHLSDLEAADAPRKKSHPSAGLTLSEIRSSLRKLAPTTYTLIQKSAASEPESDTLLDMKNEQVVFLLENLKSCMEDASGVDFIQDISILPGLCSLLKILLEDSCLQCEAVEEIFSKEGALVLACILKVVEAQPVLTEAGSEASYGNSMLLLDAFNSISDAASLMLDLPSSILLEKVLSGIAKRIPRDEGIISKVRVLIQSLMSRDWGAVLKKDPLTYLISEEFVYAADPKAVLQAYITHLFIPFAEDQDADFSSSYPCFYRPMFPVYYSVISKQLLTIASAPLQSGPEVLTSIKLISFLWHSLVKTGTAMDSDRSILITVLRTGKNFVDVFSRIMLPMMDAYLHSNRAIVLSIFKSVQQGTRKLQNICNVTKTSKDKQLSAAVPPCRSKMEAFILQVKKMFKENNILDAYTVGDLKHRDISGGIMSSQIPANEILSDDGVSSEGERVSSQAPKSLKKKRRGGVAFNKSKKARNAPSASVEPNEASPAPQHSD